MRMITPDWVTYTNLKSAFAFVLNCDRFSWSNSVIAQQTHIAAYIIYRKRTSDNFIPVLSYFRVI